MANASWYQADFRAHGESERTIDSSAVTSTSNTVEAKDGSDNAAMVEVTITVVQVDYSALCSNGTVIPSPSAAPGLVEDCAHTVVIDKLA